ncbi:hypothetical protein PSYJYH_000004 [Bacillus phage PSYJ-YH]|nr:hypothetical protein PSYJYH_000004 [Bacillus phage PSYJ-YH]
MIVLEKTIKVLKMNRKCTSKLKALKEGDEVTFKFEMNGNGGNSPKVDVYLNGSYVYTGFARGVNETFFKETTGWTKKDGSYTKPKVIESYEEVSKWTITRDSSK